MTDSLCYYVRNRVGERLAKLGFEEIDCRQFGQHLQGHGAMYAEVVAYFRRGDRLIAIPYSAGNGVTCYVGRVGADLTTYSVWPVLWTVLRMDEGLDFSDDNILGTEAFDAYFVQFPDNNDELLDFIVEKLADLPA